MSNLSTGRDYTYDKAYNKRTVKDRSDRNKARRLLFNKLKEKYGEVKARQMMRGKDVDHKKAIAHGGTTVLSNLRLLTPKKNRAHKGVNGS